MPPDTAPDEAVLTVESVPVGDSPCLAGTAGAKEGLLELDVRDVKRGRRLGSPRLKDGNVERCVETDVDNELSCEGMPKCDEG